MTYSRTIIYYDYSVEVKAEIMRLCEDNSTYNLKRQDKSEKDNYNKENEKDNTNEWNSINNDNKENNINNEHDKSIRMALLRKSEAVVFINEALKVKYKENYVKIEEQNLTLCNTDFITSNFHNKESDIIYKLKNKEIYFVIEHQSKIDYSMAYRILEYSTELMREYTKNNKQKKNKYPLIIPIVLYTGQREWNAKTYIAKMQEKFIEKEEREEEYKFGEYILVDTSKNTEQELLEKAGALSKIILLDSAKTKEQTAKRYEKVNSCKLTDEEKEILNEYIWNVTYKILPKEEFNKMREKYNKNEGGKSMLVEVLKKEIRDKYNEGVEVGTKRGLEQGTKCGLEQGIIKTIMNMIKNNLPDETIRKVTEISESKLEQIKKEVFDNKTNMNI